MTRLVRAELLKFSTTRTVWGMAAAMAVLGAIFAAITGAFLIYGRVQTGPADLHPADVLDDVTMARVVYTGAIQIGYLLALVVGVLVIGGEYRHKTLTSTLLAEPRRSRVILAKAAALSVIGVVYGVVHVAGALVGGGILLASDGLPLMPAPGDLVPTLALILLVLALWGLVGLGIGVLIPNQVAALFVAVAVVWILEPLLGLALTFVDGGDAVARFFPSQATAATLSVFSGVDPALAQSLGGTTETLTWWAGALTLAGYAIVMALVGLWLTRRRDVA